MGLHAVWLVLGLVLALGVALDAFQTIILPRRPSGRLRITRLFYLATWNPWVRFGKLLSKPRLRDQFYSIYGPLSLLTLFAVWAGLLVLAFTCVFLALGSPFADAMRHGPGLAGRFGSDLYVSGTTLFTLGLGDVTPQSHLARALVILESGTGLGFVALVIGYVPVIYQAFSRREVSVAMLDGRAGSPPTASELLDRHGYEGGPADLIALLVEWERWSAEILETHISYPILCYYRSQHDNQSWLSALVTVLDACALLITNMDGPPVRQAQLTFAMGRHALIDLGHVFHLEKHVSASQGATASLSDSGSGSASEPDSGAERDSDPRSDPGDRLPDEAFRRLCGTLGQSHMQLCGDPNARERLRSIRKLYEPHAQALGKYLQLDLPHWIPKRRATDPWKTVAALRMNAPVERVVSDQVSEHAASKHPHDDEDGF